MYARSPELISIMTASQSEREGGCKPAAGVRGLLERDAIGVDRLPLTVRVPATAEPADSGIRFHAQRGVEPRNGGLLTARRPPVCHCVVSGPEPAQVAANRLNVQPQIPLSVKQSKRWPSGAALVTCRP